MHLWWTLNYLVLKLEFFHRTTGGFNILISWGGFKMKLFRKCILIFHSYSVMNSLPLFPLPQRTSILPQRSSVRSSSDEFCSPTEEFWYTYLFLLTPEPVMTRNSLKRLLNCERIFIPYFYSQFHDFGINMATCINIS